MKKNELLKRTKEFAHRCVKLTTALPETLLGRHIRSQLIRCATSVAANYRAACRGRSKAEFISRLGTVAEESDESAFWLELIIDGKIMNRKFIEPLYNEANELTAIFTSSIISAKESNQKSKISDQKSKI